MEKFEELYQKLNVEQKKAVDAIEGSVMVIAGPGTGKTHVLALRIAKILKETDINPENILALTFTEAAASEMRKRLSGIIGNQAHRLSIFTFHGFCNDIIQSFPDEFPDIAGSISIDEIDRVTDAGRASIMGVLVELLDPAQNHAFVDAYVDYPVNLSHAIFIATANNTTRIVTAVLDRMEKISMPTYSDQEKIVIAKEYILPKLLKDAGLKPEQFRIKDDVWPAMVRPLGFDAGIRTLQRTLQGAVRKAVRIIVERGFPDVIITQENAKIFMPKY